MCRGRENERVCHAGQAPWACTMLTGKAQRHLTLRKGVAGTPLCGGGCAPSSELSTQRALSLIEAPLLLLLSALA